MANRIQDKDCVKMWVCINSDVHTAVKKFQAREVEKTGKDYLRNHAASDYIEFLHAFYEKHKAEGKAA